MTEQETISVPHDFLKWRAKENGLCRARFQEDAIYCLSHGPGEVTLSITLATGESARAVLCREAALHLARLLASAAGESWHGAPEDLGD